MAMSMGWSIAAASRSCGHQATLKAGTIMQADG